MNLTQDDINEIYAPKNKSFFFSLENIADGSAAYGPVQYTLGSGGQIVPGIYISVNIYNFRLPL